MPITTLEQAKAIRDHYKYLDDSTADDGEEYRKRMLYQSLCVALDHVDARAQTESSDRFQVNLQQGIGLSRGPSPDIQLYRTNPDAVLKIDEVTMDEAIPQGKNEARFDIEFEDRRVLKVFALSLADIGRFGMERCIFYKCLPVTQRMRGDYETKVFDADQTGNTHRFVKHFIYESDIVITHTKSQGFRCIKLFVNRNLLDLKSIKEVRITPPNKVA